MVNLEPNDSADKIQSFCKTLDVLINDCKYDEFILQLQSSDLHDVFGDNIYQLLEWLDKCMNNNKILKNEDAFKSVLHVLNNLPSIYDDDECLLNLVGFLEFTTTSSSFNFSLLLKPLASCISKCKYFARFKSSFISVSSHLNRLCLSETSNLTIVQWKSVIWNVLSFYRDTLLLSTHESDRKYIFNHSVFVFVGPLYLPIFQNAISDFINFHISTLLMVNCGSLSKLFDESHKLASFYLEDQSCDDYDVLRCIPAWISFIGFILFEKNTYALQGFWPLVYSHDFYFHLLNPLSLLILKPGVFSTICNSKGLNDIPSLSQCSISNIQLGTIEILKSLFDNSKRSLEICWWTDENVSLLYASAELACSPVSSDSLPKTTLASLDLIKEAIGSSTFHAAISLIVILLEYKQIRSHYGFRGFLITIFKDVLHEMSLFYQTNQTDIHILECCRKLFHLIYFYPLSVDSKETILDESSWLLNALNMTLYVIYRDKSVSSAHNKAILCELFRFKSSTSLFHENFFAPLKSNLTNSINSCHSEIQSIKLSLDRLDDDQSSIEKLKSDLNVKESIMNRLRLIEMTVIQVDNNLVGL